jgi:hypothetical protein
MRFEVPQFIEVEDKIFGPLTWRQFLYLGGGLGIASTLFIFTPIIVFLLIGLPIALLAAALSFYPINNRPFSYFLEAVYLYTLGQKEYEWRSDQEIVYKAAPKQPAPLAEISSTPKKTSSMASLARQLELKAIQKQT